jgi:DNA-binding GntR family transcriptional regulator
MTERVLAAWDRVRRFYIRGVLVHRVEQAQREHHAIVAAMRGRDLKTLEHLMRRHNRRALDAYMRYLDSPDARASARKR